MASTLALLPLQELEHISFSGLGASYMDNLVAYVQCAVTVCKHVCINDLSSTDSEKPPVRRKSDLSSGSRVDGQEEKASCDNETETESQDSTNLGQTETKDGSQASEESDDLVNTSESLAAVRKAIQSDPSVAYGLVVVSAAHSKNSSPDGSWTVLVPEYACVWDSLLPGSNKRQAMPRFKEGDSVLIKLDCSQLSPESLQTKTVVAMEVVNYRHDTNLLRPINTVAKQFTAQCRRQGTGGAGSKRKIEFIAGHEGQEDSQDSSLQMFSQGDCDISNDEDKETSETNATTKGRARSDRDTASNGSSGRAYTDTSEFMDSDSMDIEDGYSEAAQGDQNHSKSDLSYGGDSSTQSKTRSPRGKVNANESEASEDSVTSRAANRNEARSKIRSSRTEKRGSLNELPTPNSSYEPRVKAGASKSSAASQDSASSRKSIGTVSRVGTRGQRTGQNKEKAADPVDDVITDD